MPLKFDLEGALAEPASGLKFDIESALSPSVGRTPPQDQPLESDLAGIVQPRQELRQKPIGERIAGIQPRQVEARASRGYTPMNPDTFEPVPTIQMDTGPAFMRAIASGGEQTVGGLAEMFAVNPQMEDYGRRLSASGKAKGQQANLGNENRSFLEKGLVGAGQSAIPMAGAIAGAPLGPAGYILGGGLPMLGQIYSGAGGSESERKLSTTVQTAIEQGFDIPEAVIFAASKWSPWLRIPVGLAVNWITELGEEGAQKAASIYIEENRVPTYEEIKSEVVEAIPAVTVMTGALSGPGALMGRGPIPGRVNMFNDVLREIVSGTDFKPTGLDIVQDLYDRGRTRFANVPVQAQPELNVPGSANTLAQQPTQAAPLDTAAANPVDRMAELDAESVALAARKRELNDPANGYGPMFDTERAEIFTRQMEIAQERAELELGRTAPQPDRPVDVAPPAAPLDTAAASMDEVRRQNEQRIQRMIDLAAQRGDFAPVKTLPTGTPIVGNRAVSSIPSGRIAQVLDATTNPNERIALEQEMARRGMEVPVSVEPADPSGGLARGIGSAGSMAIPAGVDSVAGDEGVQGLTADTAMWLGAGDVAGYLQGKTASEKDALLAEIRSRDASHADEIQSLLPSQTPDTAPTPKTDGSSEIVGANGMRIVHGSGNANLTADDIQIVRQGQKQGKKGRSYGGLYGASETDLAQAEEYAAMMGGSPTVYDITIQPGTRVLHKEGDITRLSENYINDLVAQGYGLVTGRDMRGRNEYVVIDRNAVATMQPRSTPINQAVPSSLPVESAARTLNEDGRATDGKPINPGDVFRTLSGRNATPYPKQKGQKYASQWLIDNATVEAESRGDDFNARMFKNSKPLKDGTLTTADREGMLMYLFSQQPDVVPSILKPLTGQAARTAEVDKTINAKPDEVSAFDQRYPNIKEAEKAIKDRGLKQVAVFKDGDQYRIGAKVSNKQAPSNNLIQRIKQLGGINLRYLPDVAGERKVQRGMPVGLFRKNGMGLDDISRMLADEGFPINVEDPTDTDGVRQLTELLQKTLSGSTVLNYSGQQAMLDAMAKAEAEIDVSEQATLDDPEAIAEREAIKQADIAIQGVTNDELDALLDAAFNDERTPNAILYDEEIDQLFASASDASQTQPEGPDADSVAGSPEAESFALDAYTPEDLKQREVQPEPERPEAPSPADFVLSGSNRQADEAEARGQTPMFSKAHVETEAFKRWSNNAPLVTSEQADTYTFKTGERVVVEAFHGTKRPDRVGTKFLKRRATSGPMAFFTSDPTLASGYAQSKSDTSLAMEDQHYATWFKWKPPGSRSKVDIVRAWHFLDGETKQKIREIAPTLRMDDDGNVVSEEGNKTGNGSYDYNLEESARKSYTRQGNPLEALVEDWLNSGILFNDEETFLDVLSKIGFTKDVEYDSPFAEYPFVYKAYVEMQSPLVTTDVPQNVKDALNAAAKRDRTRPKPIGSDTWDKTLHTLREWVEIFNSEDNIYVWTSIPDKVTDVLRGLGYDGIIDKSGKGGGAVHPVYIPFEESQVKSAIGNKGKYDADKNDILKGVGTPTGKGMTVEDVIAYLRKRFGKRIDKMLESGTLKIVATPAQLPAWGKGQRGIGGAWDGTTAWIVASQASPETLAATYLHEVGEHAGMQEMLGDKYPGIIARLDDLIWEGDATANRAASRVPKDTQVKDEQHERLAYFIEEAQRARDSQPQTLSTKARQLLQDILAAIRAWAYRKFGGITLTEADILALAKQSAKRVADRAGQAQGQTTAEAMLQKVWHGTPHIWAPEPGFPHGRPRLDKMGTGEGAQAYGWGWYSAETPEVAKTYKLSSAWRTMQPTELPYLVNGKPYKPANIDEAQMLHAKTLGDNEYFDTLGKNYSRLSGESKTGRQYAELAKRHEELRNSIVEPDAGSLYQLDIPDAALPYLLDWDKPLSEQTKAVQKAFEETGAVQIWADRNNTTPDIVRKRLKGKDLYGALELKGMSPKAASEYLASLGIVGNRYLDGQSRDKGEGSYNYVIWDQPTLDKIALLERNGEKLDAMREAEVQMSRDEELSSEYEIPNSSGNAIATPIDGAKLRELRLAASDIEAPDKGITFQVTEDGRAIVTGPARTRVPARFQRFSEQHGLTIVVRRGPVDSISPGRMPDAFRASGALYFGEISPGIDRTGRVRFSKEPQSTDAEEMAKKFGFAIKGMADARIQPSAERAYIENQEMFERMKRGVVSNADSKAAGEALAAEVGWSPDSVDAFMKEAAQKGTPPVDILAAMFAMSRMQSIKLLEAQNPAQFIEYTMDVLRTLMATRAYGSEMGRALQFIGAMERMGGYTAADVTSEGGSLPQGQIAPPTPSQIAEQKTKAKQTAQKAKDILAKDPKLSDLVSEEAMTKALGGDKGIQKIMAAIHKQGKNVDLGMLVSYLSGMVDSIAKEQSENRTTLNKLMAMHVELWRANILTGLFTHEVNVTSNAANMLIEFGLVNPIQEMLPGGIGLGGYLDALKSMGGYRRVLADIWALMKYNAFEEAPAARLSHLLDQRDPELLALMRGTEGSKWADSHRKFIPGLAGKVVRGAGFVPLGIEDAIFKVIPFRYELARQQAAGEQRNVTAAIDAAKKLTFQDSTGMLGMVVAKMHEKAPYSEFWITFVKTMTNLIKRSFDLTPGLSQAKNWDALIGKEGDKARREAIALSIVGVGIASMVMALMGDDDDEVQLSGFAPFDRLKKLLWLEEHDNIGLRIGDEVYPFYRMSPLAEPAGLTIGAYNSIKQGEAGPLINAMYQSIVTKHFMAKIADLIDGIEEVARAEGNEKSEAGERLVRRQLGGIVTGTLIPNFIAQLGDMTDAEKREVNTIMQDLQKKIPGLRESLPSKLKVTGEVLGEPRYMSPFPVQGKPVKKDEVTRWLLKLGRGIDPNPKSIKDLPHDVRQTLLRERWEFLGYAYEASKDLDAETQEKIIRKMLSAWAENAKAARVMHELETQAD